MIEFTLETVLAIVIVLITANLLFIGFFIISVLREVKKTVTRAGTVIDEVDRSVKDGIEKAKAMNAPLQALATTATAFGGIMKTGDAIKKATQSILGGGSSDEADVIEVTPDVKVVEIKVEEPRAKPAKPAEKQFSIDTDDYQSEDYEVKIETDKKNTYKKPRFFKKR